MRRGIPVRDAVDLYDVLLTEAKQSRPDMSVKHRSARDRKTG